MGHSLLGVLDAQAAVSFLRTFFMFPRTRIFSSISSIFFSALCFTSSQLFLSPTRSERSSEISLDEMNTMNSVGIILSVARGKPWRFWHKPAPLVIAYGHDVHIGPLRYLPDCQTCHCYHSLSSYTDFVRPQTILIRYDPPLTRPVAPV